MGSKRHLLTKHHSRRHNCKSGEMNSGVSITVCWLYL